MTNDELVAMGGKERSLTQLALQSQPTYTQGTPGILARLTGSVKGFVNGWMTPGLPLGTVSPEGSPPRQFDYPVGYNVNIAPRTGALTQFETLLQMADAWDILRGIIEKRKNQLAKLQWDIKPKDKEDDGKDSTIEAIEEILRHPDGEMDWATFLRAVCEQWFVIDAVSIEPVYKPNGDIYGFYGIHGATVQLKIDERGRLPEPPNVAYQQVIKGVPYANFTKDSLIYKPQNVRFNKVFGFSRVEQILLTANIGLRRQSRQLLEFTEGTMPEAMMAVPDGWTPGQIREYQDYFDSRFAGNLKKRAQLTFVPHGSAPVPYKENPFKNELDEWLARLGCFFFNMDPSAFIKQVNRATAQSAKETGVQDGTEADMLYIKGLVDRMVQKYMRRPDLELVWREESQVDPHEEMEVRSGYIKVGVKSVDEVRAEMGLDPVGMGPAIYTATGAVLIKDIVSGAVPIPGTTPAGGDDPKNPKGGKPKNLGAGDDPKAGKTARRTVRRLPLPGKTALVKGVKNAVGKIFRSNSADVADSIWLKVEKRMAAKAGDEDDGDFADDVVKDVDLSFMDSVPYKAGPFLELATKGSMRGAIAQIVDDEGLLSQLLDQADEEAIRWAKDHAAEMVGKKWVDGELVDNPDAAYSITDTTRSMLRDKIAEALKSGTTKDDLAKSIALGPFSDSRADMIAQTELGFAHSQATMAGWRATGQVEGKKSLLSNDHDVEDECDDNADQGEIGIDEDFDSGDDTSPFHPRCQCDVVAVLKPLED